MDKQQLSIKYLVSMVSRVFLITCLLLIIAGCKKDPEASHQGFIDNTTESNLVFQIKRGDSFIRIWKTDLPSKQKTMYANGAEHLSGSNIVFQAMNENYGLPTDTVEILRDGEIVVKWGGPLRVMPDSINHFYNENSWVITHGGRKCKWERGTFTIYESDLGKIEGN